MLQMDLKADVSTTMVTELSPKTDYTLTLYVIYPSLIGDSATITIKTSGCQCSAYSYTNQKIHIRFINMYAYVLF